MEIGGGRVGLGNWVYRMALGRGKSVEKKEIRTSTGGQWVMSVLVRITLDRIVTPGRVVVADLPSSRITISPNSLTSTPPFSISTNLVKISLMALLLALTSIAQTPSTTGSSVELVMGRSIGDVAPDGGGEPDESADAVGGVNMEKVLEVVFGIVMWLAG